MKSLRLSLLLVALAASLGACAQRKPPVAPPVAVVVPVLPKPLDRTIGKATMMADGTIVLELNTSMDSGPGHLVQRIKKSDVQYASTLRQIGGLRPGESKPLTDYPVQ